MPHTAIRYRSADVAAGYAVGPSGAGVAYAAIATGTGRTIVKLPFTATVLPGLDGREVGYAAVTAIAAHLRGRGFNRVRIRIADGAVVDDLNARSRVLPALAMAYVRARCSLHGFAVARVERGEPIETHDLQTRAEAEIALRAPAAA